MPQLERNESNVFLLPLDSFGKISKQIRVHATLKEADIMLNLTINLIPYSNQASIFPSEIRGVALWYDPLKSAQTEDKSMQTPPKLRVYSLQLSFGQFEEDEEEIQCLIFADKFLEFKNSLGSQASTKTVKTNQKGIFYSINIKKLAPGPFQNLEIEFQDPTINTGVQKQIIAVCDSSLMQAKVGTTQSQNTPSKKVIHQEMNRIRKTSTKLSHFELPSSNYWVFSGATNVSSSKLRLFSNQKTELLQQQYLNSEHIPKGLPVQQSIKVQVQIAGPEGASETIRVWPACGLLDIETQLHPSTGLTLRDYFVQTNLASVAPGYYSNPTKLATDEEKRFFEKQQHYLSQDYQTDTIFSSMRPIQMKPAINFDENSQKIFVEVPRFVPSTQLLNDLPTISKISVSYILVNQRQSFCPDSAKTHLAEYTDVAEMQEGQLNLSHFYPQQETLNLGFNKADNE